MSSAPAGRIDPTRTGLFRRRMNASIKLQFEYAKREIENLLRDRSPIPVMNADDCGANAPGGGGFQPGNTCSSGNPSERKGGRYLEKIREKSKEIQFSEDEIRGDIGRRDYDEIEASMTVDEQREMEAHLEGLRQTSADDIYDFDISDRDVYESLGVNVSDLGERLSDKLAKIRHQDADELTDEEKEEIENWENYTSEIADDYPRSSDIDGYIKKIINEAPQGIVKDTIEQEWSDLQDEVNEERSRMEDSQRDMYRDEYDSSQDRRDYLTQFYDDNSEKFSSPEDNDTWYRKPGGDSTLRFETSSGRTFDIDVWSDPKDKIHGVVPKQLVFKDESGSFSKTGRGEAIEIFGKVSAAAFSYMENEQPELLMYTAAEESRQELYDKLTKTIGAGFPEYSAVSAIRAGAPKTYFITKKENLPKLQEYLQKNPVPGLKTETLLNSVMIIELVEPMIDPRWFGDDITTNSADRIDSFESRLEEILYRNVLIPVRTILDTSSQEISQLGAQRFYNEWAAKHHVNNVVDTTTKSNKHFRTKLPLDADITTNAWFISTYDKARTIARKAYNYIKGQVSRLITKTVGRYSNVVQTGTDPSTILKEVKNDIETTLSEVQSTAQDNVYAAYATGQVAAIKNLPIQAVSVIVEWQVRRDNSGKIDSKVCPLCKILDGHVFTPDQIEGLLPRHPNCRCVFRTALVTAITPDMRAASQLAVEESRRLSKEAKRGDKGWAKGFPLNVFCPTGEGGGVDPTCTSAKTKLSQLPDALPEESHFDNQFGPELYLKNLGYKKDGTMRIYGLPSKKTIKDFGVEVLLDPSDVKYGQLSVTKSLVERKIDGEQKAKDSLDKDIIVVKDGDNLYQQTGHHRSAAEILKTGKFRAKVIEVESRSKTGKINWKRPEGLK